MRQKSPPNHLISEMKASCELFTDIVLSYLNPAIDLEKVKATIKSKTLIEKKLRNIRSDYQWSHEIQDVLDLLAHALTYDHLGIVYKGRTYAASQKDAWPKDKNFSAILKQLIHEQGSQGKYQSHTLLTPHAQTPLKQHQKIAGLLAYKSEKIDDLMVFFANQEIEKEVNWGGKPNTVNIIIKDDERLLEPRSSFALWRQKLTGHAREWDETDTELLTMFLQEIEENILRTENECIKRKLHEASYKDSLTHLPNRRYLEEYINNLLKSPGQTTQLTLLFLDLDNFKKINDYIGHQAGDHLLKKTARRLSDCVRDNDTVVRLGGDEFIILIQHTGNNLTENKAAAKTISEKIIEITNKPVIYNTQPLITTPSIGAITSSLAAFNFNEALRQADIAMYHAKNTGKNKVHFFSEVDQQKVDFEGSLESELRKNISDDSIEIHYQPQMDQNNQVIGAEALVRWHHPQMGWISPELFIPISEKNHIINELGLLIFQKVCNQFAHWKKSTTAKNLQTLSINISPMQLASKSFYQDILTAAQTSGVASHAIVLEITESIFMENFDQAITILKQLKSAGFKISLDDFGTGYSSLSYLLRLPIDEVKIDKSFISSICKNDASFTMIESIIDLCNKMHLSVVAEGVETKIQYNLLKELGCKIYQGYYLGRPVRADDFKFKFDKND
jgi:diguanylate cyclase (GGDEF)-like protein